MDIVCGIDNRFVQPCSTLMVSIFENNKDVPICIHIITSGLYIGNESALKEIASRYNQEIIIHLIKNEILKDCPIKPDEVLTLAAYNRILIPLVLSNHINKCLYLDADIIVKDSLLELYNTNITNYAAGVIIDQSVHDIRHYNRLGYSMESGYFNSGVILYNLNFWREHNLVHETLSYIRDAKTILRFHDQDALNFVLREKKVFLPLKYNVQFSFFYKNPLIAKALWNEMIESCLFPTIIHYTNYPKPWQKGCTHPYRSEYIYYQNFTPWKYTRLQSVSLKRDTIRFLKKICLLLKIIKPQFPATIREEFYKFYK